MEKLKLDGKMDLQVYCFSVRLRDLAMGPPTIPVPNASAFIIAYTTEWIVQASQERFGTANIDIIIHGQTSFKRLIEQVEMPQPEPQVITKEIPVVAAPNYNKQQFIQNVRLLADRYVQPEDKETFLAILSRSKVDNEIT